jgi:hypothetical protein
MATTNPRRNTCANIVRGFETWRLEEQMVTKAYALLVPALSRKVALASFSHGRHSDRGADAQPRRQAVGG